MPIKRTRIYPLAQALGAALLFGASAPLAKLLLGEIEPIPLAACLYLGSGLGLLLLRLGQRLGARLAQGAASAGAPPAAVREAPLARADLPWLAGSILAGGVAAPVVLLFSLRATPAATASLLLNFEGVATTLIAALAFHESIGRRAWWAIGLITLAGVALSVQPDGTWGLSMGAAGVMLACALWGVDNNLTANISAKDPLAIVTAKGLGAGGVSLALALLLRQTMPPAPVAVAGMALGALSYGLSIVLFIHALRGLGAARTSALYGTAPLAGVALSLLLLRELPPWTLLPALPLMLVGTLLLAGEHHAHRHRHAALTHDHAHTHGDDHHHHGHPGGEPRAHAHLHSHSEGAHEHAHLPDLHHRHDHRIDP